MNTPNDTRSSDLHRAAELANRNERNLAHWHHRRLAYVMGRVERNMSAFVSQRDMA